MNIYNLADYPQHLSSVIEMLFSEWGEKENPQTGTRSNYDYWASWVSSSLSKTDVPQTYIAIEDNILVATYSLWRCDLQSRQDLFPWFGGLYVLPAYRNQGIGKKLQRHALSVLKQLGYSKVYLFADFRNYYETTGWVHIGMIPDEKNEFVNLYEHEL